MDLHKNLMNLPASSGVYLMKDSLGYIMYVGKSKNLKNRVRSYFQQSKDQPPKIKKLVKNIKDFDLILTDTEFEALLLECKLIQELKPLYNKKLKSPQSYTYIGIQMKEGLRQIEITSIPLENEGNLYFGPYTSKNIVERAIQGLKQCFMLMCNNPFKKSTPCLNHSLGLCMGICLGGKAVEEYNLIIHKVIGLLNGSDMSILEEMKQRMFDASRNFDFEAAVKYRDSIDALSSLIHKEKVIEFTEENNNIAVIECLNDGTMKLFLIKKNRILFSEKYDLESSAIEQLTTKIKTSILNCFKTKTIHSATEVSKFEIDEAQIIYHYLKSSSTSYIVIPEKWLESENTLNLDKAIIELLTSESSLRLHST